MKLDDLLSKLGLKYTDLSEAEKNTYLSWLETLNSGPASTEDIKSYIKKLREIVSFELSDADEFTYVLFVRVPNRKHTGLKARLKNYLLLEAFVESKEAAKKALEKQIDNRLKKA